MSRAVGISELLKRKRDDGSELCTHVLMVAGRYFPMDMADVLASSCDAETAVAVQTPTWMVPLSDPRWRQETSAYGFDKRWAGMLFNWSLNAGASLKQLEHALEPTSRGDRCGGRLFHRRARV